jgi:glycosyltransferase involved in cell wall biosynthesis
MDPMRLAVDGKQLPAKGGPGAPAITVVVPVTERHDDIREIYREYRGALAETCAHCDMVFVIDGDFPVAYRELKAIKEEGEELTIVRHARAFGEATALMSGFGQAAGEFVMTLPAYRQVEAGELPKLLERIAGHDMVIVRRWPRTDSRLNRIQTHLFRSLVRAMTGDITNDIGCSVRLMRREVVEEIVLYGDLHRFLPIMAQRQGFRVVEIDLPQSREEKRVRTYPFGIYIRRMIDLLTVFFLIKFTKKPLRFFGLTGTALVASGLAVTFDLVFQRLVHGVGLSGRPLLLLGILLIVLGLQIFAIGLIGEIIIFTHARDMKDYTIAEIIN